MTVAKMAVLRSLGEIFLLGVVLAPPLFFLHHRQFTTP